MRQCVLTSPQSCSCSCCHRWILCWPVGSWLTLLVGTPLPYPSPRSSVCCCCLPYPPFYLPMLLWQTEKVLSHCFFFACVILTKGVISYQASHVIHTRNPNWTSICTQQDEDRNILQVTSFQTLSLLFCIDFKVAALTSLITIG